MKKRKRMHRRQFISPYNSLRDEFHERLRLLIDRIGLTILFVLIGEDAAEDAQHNNRVAIGSLAFSAVISITVPLLLFICLNIDKSTGMIVHFGLFNGLFFGLRLSSEKPMTVQKNR